MAVQGIALEKMPLIIQFNKRDLPGARSVDEIADMARKGTEPVYLAVATRGDGVVESFIGLLHRTWLALDREHALGEKFGFDGDAFVAGMSQKLGNSASLQDVLGKALAGKKQVQTDKVSRGGEP